MSYETKIYRKQGGAEEVFASGGTLTAQSGSLVDINGTFDPPEAADANVVGAVELVHRVNVPDAATGDVDVVLTYKSRVIDVTVVKTGANAGAANTITVKNGANAITDAISINVNDGIIARAGSIDDTHHEIAAGGTLRITRTRAGGNAECIVYVKTLRVA